MALDEHTLREAVRRIAAWRTDQRSPVTCPACGRIGLRIVDRSARPHAEWYILTCAGCDLDETVNIPLGPAVPSLD
jgi:hypothetical protein